MSVRGSRERDARSPDRFTGSTKPPFRGCLLAPAAFTLPALTMPLKRLSSTDGLVVFVWRLADFFDAIRLMREG